MNHLRRSIVFFLAIGMLSLGVARAEGPYEPTWESLRKHQTAPEWFRDAKFGIYFHWGVYSVPAYGNEWYPRLMHDKGNEIYKHHKATYGDPSEFGYDKFVPMFTAEHFDADEWVDLFDKAGARFAGPVSEHHDGFAMWDSELTPWNSMDRGPNRDITGEMAKALRKHDMKLFTTFHHARNNLWEKEDNGQTRWTGHYSDAKTNFPEVLEDKERAYLYGYMSREEFLDMWSAKLNEVIDNYSPDIIYFDSWLDEIPEQNRREFLAHYFNHAAQTGQEVLVTYKQQDMPQDVCVLDIEKGAMDEKTDFIWLTDDTISLGSWCYTDSLQIKPTKVVLHSLVDIVSKNGQMVLNVSPMADGTIPENQRQVLLEMGQWLGEYGEAIYSTRPFIVYGHGPTTTGAGHFGGIATDKAYTAQDIRYTQSKDGRLVYAIQLGRPEEGEKVLLKGFAKSEGPAPRAAKVTMLGVDGEVEFVQNDQGVTVTSPAGAPDEMAVVYKIELAI